MPYEISDNTTNVVRPILIKIQQKKKDTHQKRKQEQGKVPRERFYELPKRVETPEQMVAPGYDTEMRELWQGPVYSISLPSELTFPRKSILFDPSIIDNMGKMKIIWGRNSNLINSLIPTTLGGTYLFNQK